MNPHQKLDFPMNKWSLNCQFRPLYIEFKLDALLKFNSERKNKLDFPESLTDKEYSILILILHVCYKPNEARVIQSSLSTLNIKLHIVTLTWLLDYAIETKSIMPSSMKISFSCFLRSL